MAFLKNLKVRLNENTKFSRILGTVLFAFLPFLFFFVGMNYQAWVQESPLSEATKTETVSNNELEEMKDEEEEEKPNETPKDEVIVPEHSKNSIFYQTRGADINDFQDDEVWSYDLETGEKKEVLLEGGVSSIRNSLGNRFFAYTYYAGDDSMGIWLYDIEENKSSKISPDFPEYLIPNFYMGSHAISPDGRFVVYSYDLRDNSQNCGHGPCPETDAYPEFKSGQHVYDTETGKTVFAGDFLTISSWSSDSNHFYTSNGYNYHEYDLYNGTFKINALTAEAETIESGTKFNDSVLITPNGDKFTVFSDSNLDSSNLVYIPQNGSSVELDSHDYAGIQPQIYPYQDRSIALYQKRGKWDNGYVYYNLRLLDTTTKEVKTVYTQQDNIGFTDVLGWIDKNTVIIMDTKNTLSNTPPYYLHRILKLNLLNGQQEILMDFNENLNY